MLIRKIIVTVLFGLSLLISFPINATEKEKDKVLLSILKYVLTQGHYHPQEMDDAFSEDVFNDFINKLDSSKRYFLQSDIDEFSKYKTLIDDQIKNEDLTFFFLVHDRFIQRFNESKIYYEEILATEFNFDKKEILDVNYENKKYATNKTQLIQNWLKQLKFSTLSRIHDKITDEEDKKKEDETYQVKSFKELEVISREATLSNMNDFYERMDELTSSDWFSTFVNCITEDFDPHTTYLDPSLKKRFDISMAGKLEGIGARLMKKNDYTKVSEIISGGPAWKQGELEPEDLITKVAQGDEEPVDIVGMRLDDAIEYIKGKKGTEVKLTVKKIDGTVKVISIIRDVVELDETFVKSSIVKKENKTFGVINLPKFYIDFDEKNYRNSATDMEQEIERLKEENIEGLVIDLRNNGGGSLKTAIEITGLFIDKGPVVQVKYRDENAKVKSDEDSKVVWDGPLVVLVNEMSASASEIFAAAMQDYGRAIVIGGKQTYGKGTVQSVLDLNRYTNLKEDLGALKMTIQKFYRINGGSTQLEGVKSDIIIPSRYSYMEIGERDLPKALQFDKVPQATYNLWNYYKNFDKVINNSKKRISTNSQFKLIDENAKWLKKSQDDTIIYLSYEDYKNDLESHKSESEKYESIYDYSTNLTYSSPNYEQAIIKTDEGLAEKRERWHKNLKKDIYMEEALNVVSELKIKPSHLLVKN
ncbi:carboxy terminal-processing peptidase [Lutibacter sp. TH_r2]|uniref:carboxy terminal-processing peptidase n=1 Tax=Lutibacter sp. TH_r2 TaxID=3082083 RepID=UPI002954820C|nr:carboxy terminal-processing peptidase [Lutibacter sp. TH_r2]MDV7187668.1 carboxy terminal-processing peptidase [Lutibacter sp. TH_r2]